MPSHSPTPPDSGSSPAPRRWLGLLQRRAVVVPTWKGWLAGVVLLVAGFVGATRSAYPFLAVHDPRPGGVLVVEGWVPDYALDAVVAELRRGAYRTVYVTGGPLESGAPLSEYQTYAGLGAATLLRKGLPADTVVAAPAPLRRTDRTFASALALRDHLQRAGPLPPRLTVVSMGPHSRRSRLLFETAFGPGTAIGILPVEPFDYDPRRWWRSSMGFRDVTKELIAYLYARFLFDPGEAALASAPRAEPVSRNQTDRP